MKQKLTRQQKEQLGKEYLEGKLFSELSEQYKVSLGTIHHYLVELGIPRRPQVGERVYFLNESVFDAPLSEEAQYWAGFLMADGNILDTRKGQMTIQINKNI